MVDFQFKVSSQLKFFLIILFQIFQKGEVFKYCPRANDTEKIIRVLGN